MPISISPGARHQTMGAQSVEVLTQSTTTVAQTLSNTSYVSALGAGTATGSMARNLYNLATTALDGTEKMIYLSATGEASLTFPWATGQHYIGRDVAGVATATNVAVALIGAATGGLVFIHAAAWARMIFLNGGWTVLGGNATFGTTT